MWLCLSIWLTQPCLRYSTILAFGIGVSNLCEAYFTLLFFPFFFCNSLRSPAFCIQSYNSMAFFWRKTSSSYSHFDPAFALTFLHVHPNFPFSIFLLFGFQGDLKVSNLVVMGALILHHVQLACLVPITYRLFRFAHTNPTSTNHISDQEIKSGKDK